MVIERKSPRHSTYKTAHIVFDGGENVIRCSIRNLSDTGAALALAPESYVPRAFDLLLETDVTTQVIQGVWRTDKKMVLRPCVSVWRSGPRLGLKFQ
jgi:hypothetical protein